MFRYSAFALTIDSELELPELAPGNAQPDIVIRLATVPRAPRAANLKEHFLFPRGVGRFLIKHGCEIIVDPLPEADYSVLRNILLGRIMALLLRQRGWLPLHASAVAIAGQGIAFVGPSGKGKSTTAAAFHARGFLVIADDVAAVRVRGEKCEVLPAWSHLRLTDDSRSVLATTGETPAEFQVDKHRFNLAREELRESFPLKRIYMLEYGSTLRIEVIAPLPAVVLLNENTTSAPWMEPDLIAHQLRSCTSVAAAAPIYRLVRPRSLSALAELVCLVEKDVGSSR